MHQELSIFFDLLPLPPPFQRAFDEQQMERGWERVPEALVVEGMPQAVHRNIGIRLDLRDKPTVKVWLHSLSITSHPIF